MYFIFKQCAFYLSPVFPILLFKISYFFMNNNCFRGCLCSFFNHFSSFSQPFTRKRWNKALFGGFAFLNIGLCDSHAAGGIYHSFVLSAR